MGKVENKKIGFFKSLMIIAKRMMKAEEIINSTIIKRRFEYHKDVIKCVAIGLLDFSDLDKESKDLFLQKISIKVIKLEEANENE